MAEGAAKEPLSSNHQVFIEPCCIIGGIFLLVNVGGVFRTKSNIYDGAFLRKELTTFSR